MKRNFLSDVLATQNLTQESFKDIKKWWKSDLSELLSVSRLLRSKLSKGGKPYQPHLDHSYKIWKTSGAIVKKYLSQNWLYFWSIHLLQLF